MAGATTKTEFTSADGQKLAAALEMPDGAPRAYALFAHCFTCTKDIKSAREISRGLREAGIAVLRFDFTGLGSSEGDFANTNFSSNVDDLIHAADFMRDSFEAPKLIIGHSLGGAAVITAANRIPELKGVAVIGAPAHADHVTMQLGDKRDEIEKSGEAEVLLAGRPFKVKKQFLDDLSSQTVLECAETLGKPLLILHAPLDNTVGIENAGMIFGAAKHPKSFISLDTADHLLSNTKDAHYAAGVLSAWAQRYIGAVDPSAEKHPSAAPTMKGGAAAVAVASEPLATAVSIDGYPLTLDAASAEGGSDLGPNPTRTVEAALAACGVMTVRMYARRKNWAIDAIEIRVKRAAAEDEHAPHTLEKEVRISGDLDHDQIARLLEISDKCPVHRMLTGEIAIRSRVG
ncbi:MAG: alpha/beta fold hydrolase [Pseudomonadota bacterium]